MASKTNGKPIRVLGLDPGLASTGWCVLDVLSSAERPRYVGSGVIKTENSDGTHVRTRQIASRTRAVFQDFAPSFVFAESFTNYGRIFWTAVQTLYGLGAIIAVAESFGLSVEPIGARESQLAIGVKDGTKGSVQERTRELLGLEKVLRPVHCADAAKIALAGIKSLKHDLVLVGRGGAFGG